MIQNIIQTAPGSFPSGGFCHVIMSKGKIKETALVANYRKPQANITWKNYYFSSHDTHADWM